MFVPFFKASIDEAECNAVVRVLKSGWITTGDETLQFEREFAKFVGAKNALAVNSATSGLQLAYNAAGIGAGTKILTTPYTFTSTANAARNLGAEIAYADICASSFSIDPLAVEKTLAADDSIRAIVPVHIGGNVCEMAALGEIAAVHRVSLIEDAAHAFPSKTKDGFAGTFGDAGVFSFYATKTITTAEGGMVVTDSDEMAATMERHRLHGIDRPVWNRYADNKASWFYDVTDCGFKCNLPDVLSAIGRVQLKKAETMHQMRVNLAAKFNAAFKDCDFCELPPDGDGNAWHLYILRLNLQALRCSRDEFLHELQAAGLGVSVHFIPHFRLSFWKNRYGLDAKNFPNAEKAFLRSISLPFFPSMTDDEAAFVVETVKKTASKFAR